MKSFYITTGLLFNVIFLFSQSFQAVENNQIPIVSSEQRQAIVNPTNGLLVFDNTTKNYWLYNGKLLCWEELSSLKTNKFNNYTDSDIFFDDLRVPVTATKLYGSKEPTFDLFVEDGVSSHGVFTFWFDSEGEEELYFTVQLPHGWKEGSNLYPHVHWVSLKDLNETKVKWSLEYSWANVGAFFPMTQIISSTTIYGPNIDPKAYQHFITDIGVIEGQGKKISSMLVCRIFRAAEDEDDTFSAEAGLLEIDFHIEMDSFERK